MENGSDIHNNLLLKPKETVYNAGTGDSINGFRQYKTNLNYLVGYQGWKVHLSIKFDKNNLLDTHRIALSNIWNDIYNFSKEEIIPFKVQM